MYFSDTVGVIGSVPVASTVNFNLHSDHRDDPSKALEVFDALYVSQSNGPY